jgi:hypothetical protein
MDRRRLSDREKAGLRGPVKTCSAFTADKVESMYDAEYDTDGRLLVWRNDVSNGSRVDQVYSYDGMGRLIGITGGADGTDEFHYDEQGKKTRVRTIPPRPEQQGMATGVDVMFELTEEGYGLNRGGSVTTRYNDDDQPIESLVRDAQRELLTKIVHNYADGRLINETLVKEAFELSAQLREKLSEEQQRAIGTQMKAVLSQIGFASMGVIRL